MNIYVKKSVLSDTITKTCIPINPREHLVGGVLIDSSHLLLATHVPHKNGRPIFLKKRDGSKIRRSISSSEIIGRPDLDLSLLKLRTPLEREDHDIFDITPVEAGDEVLIYRTTMFGNRRPFISKIAVKDNNMLFAMAGDQNKSMLRPGDSGLPWFVKKSDGSYGLVSLTSRIWCGIGPDLFSLKEEIETVKKFMS